MIVLDPATIAIPNYSASDEEAETLILRLKHFAQVCLAEEKIVFLVSDILEQQLGINIAYPQKVKDFLQNAGLYGVYDSKDLLRSIETLQHKSIRVSAWKNYFEVEAASIELDPPIAPGQPTPELVPITTSNLLFVSVARSRGHQVVLTSPFSSPKAIDYSLVGTGVSVMDKDSITDIGEHKGTARAIAKMSCVVSGEFALDLWKAAADAEDLAVAISIGSISLLKASGTFPVVLPRLFSVGSGFYKSLIENQAVGDGKFASSTAQTCFELVANLFTGTDRIFGKTVAKIREHDKAEGRRCHATKSNEGLRLMYWKTKSGIEFANLGPKNERFISVGDADCKCSCFVEEVYRQFAE